MNTQTACSRIEEEGYCVLEGLLEPGEAARLESRARQLITDRIGKVNEKKGYANLEGALIQMPELAPLCAHPVFLEIAGHFFSKRFFLANNACIKWVKPGGADGPLHSDWPPVPEPYPPWPMFLQTMWMLTDFTAENGATRIVPGSHRWGKRPTVETDTGREVVAAGPAGSLLIWNGFLWHRSAANTTTDRHRVGANVAYLPHYIHRPHNWMWPDLPVALYQTFPETLRELLERSVEPH